MIFSCLFRKEHGFAWAKYLALIELKLVVATVIKQYGIALGDNVKLGDMDLKDNFLAGNVISFSQRFNDRYSND